MTGTGQVAYSGFFIAFFLLKTTLMNVNMLKHTKTLCWAEGKLQTS